VLTLAACTLRPALRLPTAALLDPAAPSAPLGSMPLAMTFSPDSARVVVVLSGLREQGLQVVDPARRRVTQTLEQPGAFLGVAFAPDGKTLYASGGVQDLVYRYAWAADSAALADSIRLDANAESGKGERYPSGIGISPDGKRLYVAENLADSLAVVDTADGRVLQRVEVGPYPYGVVVGPEGRIYVSAWGGDHVATFTPQGDSLGAGPRFVVGRHPSALALNASGTRLFVARASFDRIAVVDTNAGEVIAELSDAAGEGPSEGSTPNGLSLSRDGCRLWVAEADNNAAAAFDLSAATADRPEASGNDTLVGRVPVEWYPTAVLTSGHSLLVLNGKGIGTAPNPRRRHPGVKAPRDLHSYTLGQTSGSLTVLPGPTAGELAAMSRRVARAQGWDRPRPPATWPPFSHVIYVIKENRTYDQVLGDLPDGDGDPALLYFPREVTPNHHALAERFGIFDRFFVNAEVSADGHNWTTAAYASDYVEKTTPSVYSDRGREYDFQGESGGDIAEDDVAEPGNGYLWDSAVRAGITLRNYGEYTHQAEDGRWIGTKPSLAAHTAEDYPGWDMGISDCERVEVWQREFEAYVAGGSLPALTILWLPSDHTSGAAAGKRTPRACMADNDLALGRVVDAVTHSPYWKDTVIFVLEDDAQDGPDHVDSHRAPFLAISAYSPPGVVHRFVNTSDVVATIVSILHLESLSQFDYFGRPLAGVFAAEPDLSPYDALPPGIDLDERNPEQSSAGRMTELLDLASADAADEELFNRVLWAVVKGPKVPYPGSRRTPLPIRGAP